MPGIPGINGLRATDRALLTVNSSTGQLLEVPLHGGPIVVLAADLPGDGLAVGADGSVFVVTHPFNTIERIAPGGARTTIGSSANGVWGPTDIDVLPNGDLLVVQDGGAFVRLLPAPVRLLFPSAPYANAQLLRLRLR
ncbi:MAG: hypothetical protein JNK05_06520 [Myxococcales bacterium]|nr:hypothetical protein [Myxococcales bacterium]